MVVEAIKDGTWQVRASHSVQVILLETYCTVASIFIQKGYIPEINYNNSKESSSLSVSKFVLHKFTFSPGFSRWNMLNYHAP